MTSDTVADRTGETRDHPGGTVAEQLHDLVAAMVSERPPLRIEFWDGSALGADDGPGTLRVTSPDALRRILWAPGELGVARAFVTGDIEAEGDMVGIVSALSVRTPRDVSVVRVAPSVVAAARRLGAFGPPLPPPPIEARPPGVRRHTIRRDAEVISHHYDVSNEFYARILGPSMTYSCARFAEPGMDLVAAQASKHDHVCRKLGLDAAPGSRLLDVGCGWGSMAIHAASRYGARVVGITISTEQARLARERVRDAGLEDQVDIRLQDYREIGNETFDAISSIGMSEHVGSTRLDQYFEILHGALRPQGRLLNHAISSVGGSKLPRNSFIYRYVFPDGELIDVADTLRSMEAAGFEIRDVESLREHYATTLRHWVANLEANWDEIVAEAGIERARVWLLYMAASAVGFDDGGNNVHQVLGVVPDAAGRSAMPPTRPA
jgi:cyclopropane-fatty-acyl-phospholipid synthase